jgi:hypothetical protein
MRPPRMMQRRVVHPERMAANRENLAVIALSLSIVADPNEGETCIAA